MVHAAARAVCAGICPVLMLWPVSGVLAQEVKTEPRPGEIIISRDVEYRAIGSPNVPGAISTIDAGPDELILSSISIGLTPITDGEAAQIASGPQSGGGIVIVIHGCHIRFAIVIKITRHPLRSCRLPVAGAR